MVLICICSLSLLLIHHAEYLIAFTCSGASSAIVECRAKRTISFSFGGVCFILIESLVLARLWTSVRGSHFVHEVAIEHGLPHLLCVIGYLTYRSETIGLGLVENLLLLVHIRKHFVDA